MVLPFGACTVAVQPERVDMLRSYRTHRRYHLRRRGHAHFETI
jgi:hypothetical protein